jgi:hypothetical protein
MQGKNRMKRQTIEWEKILANNVSENSLLQLNRKKELDQEITHGYEHFLS